MNCNGKLVHSMCTDPCVVTGVQVDEDVCTVIYVILEYADHQHAQYICKLNSREIISMLCSGINLREHLLRMIMHTRDGT